MTRTSVCRRLGPLFAKHRIEFTGSRLISKSYLGIFSSSDAEGYSLEELSSGATAILCTRRENVRSSRRDGNPSFLFNSEFQPWRRSFPSIELPVCRSDAFTTCFGATSRGIVSLRAAGLCVRYTL